MKNADLERDDKLEIKEPKSEPRPLFCFDDGRILVSSSRQAICTRLETRQVKIPELLLRDSRFETKLGCFVTLKTPEGDLRGCIGFAEPIHKLSKALTHAAIAAATEDPRFRPLISKAELDSLLSEVSILSAPRLIDVKSPMDLPSKIRIGYDGLILRWACGSGLFLPQVAKEEGWNARDYLANLSMKAGAPPDEWLVEGTLVYSFQAQVFREREPNGSVVLETE